MTVKPQPIIVCPATEGMARESFTFRDLGERHARGFAKPHQVFALLAAQGDEV